MLAQSQAVPLATSFAWLLRQLRTEARLTQEELAWKTGLSPRSISDLERGISRTARRSTADALANALAVEGSVRTAFVAAARGRAPVSDVLAAWDDAPATRVPAHRGDDESLSRDEVKLVRQLIETMSAAAAGEGSAIAVIWLGGLKARGE